MPEEWRRAPAFWEESQRKWEYELYRAIGNGVPVYMAKAFGDALNKPVEEWDWYLSYEGSLNS